MNLRIGAISKSLISSVIFACLVGVVAGCGEGSSFQAPNDGNALQDLFSPDALVPTLPDDPDEEPVSEGSENDIADQFEEPDLNADEIKAILKKYSHVDKNDAVPSVLLNAALVYYDVNLEHIPNKERITVIDYSRHSKFKRMFIVNIKTGAVWAMHVTHGKGSDEDHDGIAEKFSNQHRSNATSLGFFLTGDRYYGKWGLSMYLDGLSETNSNARDRAIVLHGAPYVKNAAVRQGRSWGCPAVSMADRNRVVQILAGGTLMYSGLSKP